MKLEIPTFRRAFLTGLLVLAPLWVTAWVFVWLFRAIDDQVRPLLSRIPALSDYLPEEGIIGLGVLVAVVVVVLVGLFASNLIGRAVFGGLDKLMARIPWIKAVYGATKEISGVVFSERGNAFRKVVLFEYPRRGVYSIGFVTFDPVESAAVAAAATAAPLVRPTALARPKPEGTSAVAIGGPPVPPPVSDYLHVFLPTTPNPTSGYFLLVMREDAVVLEMSVEEGIKLVVAGGAVVSRRTSSCIDAAITRLRAS